MRKYWLIFWLTIKEYFVYRLNFLIWRFRVVLNFLITFFLWRAVFENQSRFGVYNKTQFISYIFFSNLIANFVLGTRTVDVAGEIINGEIVNKLLKPISFFKYYFTRDLADKLLNFVFVVFELWLIKIIFKPSLTLPSFNLINFVLFLIFFIIGTLISFYLSLIISFIGFWSHEVWGPRFIFMIVVFMISGIYFPLDLLPKSIFNLFLKTPFPYLFYLPTQVFFGRNHLLSPTVIFFALFWLFLTSFFCFYLWRLGNRSYYFFGR